MAIPSVLGRNQKPEGAAALPTVAAHTPGPARVVAAHDSPAHTHLPLRHVHLLLQRFLLFRRIMQLLDLLPQLHHLCLQALSCLYTCRPVPHRHAVLLGRG